MPGAAPPAANTASDDAPAPVASAPAGAPATGPGASATADTPATGADTPATDPGRWARLLEPILQAAALDRARNIHPQHRARLRTLVAAARARAAAAARLADDRDHVAALALQREALGFAASAVRTAWGDPARDGPLGTNDALDTAARVGARAVDVDRVRAALTSDDPLAIDKLRRGEAMRVRASAEAVLRSLLAHAETRTPRRVLVARVLRCAGLIVVPSAVIGAAVLLATRPTNLARDKPAIASSQRPGTPTATGAVDGTIDDECAFLTNAERDPWVRVDLLHQSPITGVTVYAPEAERREVQLPLVLEISADGENFTPVAERRDAFGRTTPWRQSMAGEVARYVRVRAPAARAELCLSEVEVFGPGPAQPR